MPSIRLPAAPPMMSARPSRASRCSAGSVAPYQASAPSASAATIESDHRLEREFGRVHQPERRAVIVHPREVEERRNDHDAFMQLERRSHDCLDDLIEHDDGGRDPKLELESGDRHQRLTGSASASTQRSQRPAQSGSVRVRRHITPAPIAFDARRLFDFDPLSSIGAVACDPTARATSDTMKSIGR